MPKKKKQSPQSQSKVRFNTLHFTCLTIILLLLSALNLVVYFSPPSTIIVSAKDMTPETDVYYLQNLLKEHPSYRDGWVQLAKLEYSLGNTFQAKLALEKVLELDPNYKGLEDLQTYLTSK